MCRLTRPVNFRRSHRAGPPLSEFTSPGYGYLRRVLHEQVYVVVLPVELPQLRTEVTADLPHRVLAASRSMSAVQDAAPVLRHEDQMNVERGNHVPAAAVLLP